MHSSEREAKRLETAEATLIFLRKYSAALKENATEEAKAVLEQWAETIGITIFPTTDELQTPSGVLRLREPKPGENRVVKSIGQVREWLIKEAGRLNLDFEADEVPSPMPYGVTVRRTSYSND